MPTQFLLTLQFRDSSHHFKCYKVVRQMGTQGTGVSVPCAMLKVVNNGRED